MPLRIAGTANRLAHETVAAPTLIRVSVRESDFCEFPSPYKPRDGCYTIALARPPYYPRQFPSGRYEPSPSSASRTYLSACVRVLMSTRDRTLAPTRSPCVGNAIARHYQVHGSSTVTPRWFGQWNVAGDVPQITSSRVYGATAGSRQPLSVLRADAVADMRLPSADALCFPRLAHASRS
jgi:hypothetical protein